MPEGSEGDGGILAVENDSTAVEPETRAARVASRANSGSEVAKPTVRRRRSTAARRPLRTAAILVAVGGLIATVAIPAYAAVRPEAETVTLQQTAVLGAQTLVVASDAKPSELDRGSYSATTPEEIEKKKAEEAAAERARQQAAAALAAASSKASFADIDLSMVAPGSGEVRWPLAPDTISHIGEGMGYGRGRLHAGVDLLANAGTPIYAATSGVVRVSTESYWGYGVAVVIDGVAGGNQVSTTYAHMTSGSRVVSEGQTVEAGQLIGLVGSTGSSTANHLHFEVKVGGELVQPLDWVRANAE